MNEQKNNIDYVKKYRSEGLNVIPCRVPEENGEREDAKKPAISWKDYEYKKYEGEIKEDANIAIICGKVSKNLVVVDVDKSDLSLVNEIYSDALKKTRVVRTGSGGYHLYFFVSKLPKKVLRLNKDNGDHIDVQVDRTYVIAPPSIHPNGQEYKIVSETDEIKNIDFQDVIVNLEKAGFTVKETNEEKLSKLAKGGVEEGQRHNSAISYCHLLYYEQELDSETIQYEMKKWNKTIRPPLPDEELNQIMKDCLKYHEENPREKKQERKRDPRGSHHKLAKSIMEKFYFKTLKENEEILVYEHGVYRPYGELTVKKECQLEKFDCYNSLVSEVIGFIQRETGYVERDCFDNQPYRINLQNGIVDIEKNRLLPHDPNQFFRVQLPIEYKPDAGGEKIMKFFNDILEEEYVEWVLDFIAYCLVKNCKHEKAMIFVGLGGNGKGTLIKLISAFLGRDNVSAHSIAGLIFNRFAVADLDGKLANMHSDIGADEIRRTGILKQLISGDDITVEHKNQPPFTLHPFAKLIFSANQMPDVKEEPKAFFQRWLVIDFLKTFRGTELVDVDLFDKLTTPEELSGLLNIVLKRVPKILENKDVFKNAPKGAELKKTWKDHANSVESFCNNEVLVEKDAKITREYLYKIYLLYCSKNSFTPFSKKTFSERFNMKMQGVMQETTVTIDGKLVRALKNIKIKNMPKTMEMESTNQWKIDEVYNQEEPTDNV